MWPSAGAVAPCDRISVCPSSAPRGRAALAGARGSRRAVRPRQRRGPSEEALWKAWSTARLSPLSELPAGASLVSVRVTARAGRLLFGWSIALRVLDPADCPQGPACTPTGIPLCSAWTGPCSRLVCGGAFYNLLCRGALRIARWRRCAIRPPCGRERECRPGRPTTGASQGWREIRSRRSACSRSVVARPPRSAARSGGRALEQLTAALRDLYASSYGVDPSMWSAPRPARRAMECRTAGRARLRP